MKNAMSGIKVPYRDAEQEFCEKKSRFIGHIFKVESPEQAQERLRALQKKHWDASHNVYAYVLQNGVMRFSDDGEPQGTAGLPTLEVLKKESVCDALCVTTRYFGGTLLGAGGLTRAYARACKLALDEAGIGELVPYAELTLDCPYPMLENIRRQLPLFGAEEQDAGFAASVALTVTLPERGEGEFRARITDLTRGAVIPSRSGTRIVCKKADEKN